MAKLIAVLVVAAILAVVTAAPSRRHFPETFVAERHAKWALSGTVSPLDTMKVTFLLSIRDSAALERKFWAVSDPKNAEYGQHLTLEELSKLVRPSSANVDALLSWFRSNGINDWAVVPNGDAYTITTTVEKIEEMLDVKMERFTSTLDSSFHIVRSRVAYSIPHELRSVIAVVPGISNFPNARKTRVHVNQHKRQAGGMVTPSVVQSELYIPAGTAGSFHNNTQAVAQFLGQFYAPSDLQAFQQEMQVPVQPVARVVGPNQPTNPGTEASLDIEYIMSTGRNIPTWFFSTAGNDNGGQEPFIEFFTSLNAMKTVPWVITISYGDYENTIPTSYMDRVDKEFQKLAARGVSIIFSSGDDGVGCNSACTKFVSNWPASSPYVTAVGGVYGGRNSGWVGDTIASGGFSAYYNMPAYQKSAVTAYMSAMAGNLPASSYYNSSHRAVPDIAAYSENVVVVVSGFSTLVGGTSCASPIIGGVFSLLNDKLFNAGRKSLGFLNPLIYSIYATHPNAFQKVTSGNNGDFCCPGFNANPNGGYNLISGVGVPNFQNLVSAVSAVLNVAL